MSKPRVTTTAAGITLEQALAGLPAKLRVHELGKRAGLTSKELIVALAQAGVTVASAASSVSAADATAVLTALLVADPPAPPTSGAAESDLVAVVADSAPEPDPGFFAAPLFLPPVEAKPARRRRGARPAAEPEPTFTESTASSGEGASARVDAAPGAADELTEAATAAVTDVDVAGPDTEVTGTPRSGRRRRGRSGRGRGEPAEAGAENQDDAGSTAGVGTTIDSGSEPAQVAATDGDLGGAQEDDDSEQAAGRRRRRGRRGRGRAGDERLDDQDASQEEEGERPDAGAEDDQSGGEPAEGSADDDSADDDEAGTRRRRRRRRRTGAADAPGEENAREDDPDNTVVHLRESRPAGSGPREAAPSSNSEVQGVRGSTRLEAKRQRRRDTRGSRSRPQILTEAEFLARREAVDRVMAVRQRGDLAQVALLEDGVLVEHFVSLAGSESLMGNIYLGKVQNVLPSMEAAFVDIGKGRNAVLYAGEVNWDAAGLAGKARRIETALSGGDTLLVQVSKDPVGQKGARLTTQISLPGRFLVYVPGGGATGISRKLPDTERKRLKSILDRIVPEDAGVIIRTAAEGVAEDELAGDVDRLKSQWEEISRQAQLKSNAPLLLSAEPDTLIKVVRDLFNSDISQLVLDGERAYEPVAAYIGAVAPELADRVSRYDGPGDVFAAYRIDEQIAKALERKVYLPSGGSLVIDRTEAMTVVDVNTGKYTGSGGNLEETVTKNNLEAAEEVVRQLRLRDIGGIIVVDFIDMVLESNRELVMRRLTECLGRDRTRHQVAEVTSLGLIQMTRKKMGTGLVEAFSEPCPHCHGRGLVLHDVPIQNSSNSADPIESDSERRARGRRGKARQDVPVLEREPVVKIVPATVRPPDPRGPKPRLRGDDHTANEHTANEHNANEPTGSQRAGSDQPASGGQVAGDRGSTGAEPQGFDTESVFDSVVATDDRSLNAPRSRDASDAVSAVFAALDAQSDREAGSRGGPRVAPAQSAPDQVAPEQLPSDPGGRAEPAPAGRRRGRRAAGRPAGAPDVVSTAMNTAPTDPTGSIDSIAATPSATEPEPAPVAQPTEPTESAATQSFAAPIESFDPIPDPVSEAEPVRRGRAPARRRGSRAAGAPVTAPTSDAPPAGAPVTAADTPVNGHARNGVTDADHASPTIGQPAASPGATQPEETAQSPADAAAPRRRRAASRPAGPAAAPVTAGQT